MTLTLTASEARRTFLAAQGVDRRRPTRRARPHDFAAYLRRQGVLQLDTVNVLARAHYLPLYSRYGAYDPAALDMFLWGPPDGHSDQAFEHWGHEASVMPRELLPAMHHRMVNATSWKAHRRDRLESERPGLLDQVRAAVEQHGPIVAADLEHLAPRERTAGPWWDHGHVKHALEYLFITGSVAASRGANFARTYDRPMRGWGLPPADSGSWGMSAQQGHQALFDKALAACAIGTARDLCDHFRLPYAARPAIPGAVGGQAWAASAVERGLAHWVTVDGWDEPALLAAHAPRPVRVTGRTLLSPFDPVCWYRPRLRRMFGVDYRIEIYTPAAKREYGYYCLPLLMGEQIVGRFDLQAYRKAGVLLVQASWREPGQAAGARRVRDHAVVQAAIEELRAMADWLGLGEVVIAQRGTLAHALVEAHQER